MRLVWIGTAAAVAVVAIVVGVLLATRSSPNVPAPATASAADKNAPASLIAAAAKIGFHPNVEAGVGVVEYEPASKGHAPANPNLLRLGAAAPTFTLRTPEGQTVALSSYRGRAVLLEFFATWCPHCDAEAPHLRTLDASLTKSGAKVAFLEVNADGETAPSVYAYHAYFGLQFPALLDPSSQAGSFSAQGAAGPVSTAYHVLDFPTFYIVNPKGVIAWRGDGEQPDALLRQELVKAAASSSG